MEFGLSPADVGEILSHAQGDFAELFCEARQTTTISAEAHQIERVLSGWEVGAGIRILREGNTAYSHTNNLTLEHLKKLAVMVSRAALSRKASFVLSKVEPPYVFPVTSPPEEKEIAAKTALVLRAEKSAWAESPRIQQVSISYSDTVQKVLIANSLGEYLTDKRTRVRLAVNVVAAAEGIIQTGYEAAGGFAGLEFFEANPPENLARKAAQRAVLMLSAAPAPAGTMPVVIAGEAGGTMIHEACGHGLEADLVQKGLSIYAGKRGEQVASPLVTVVDDATLPGKYGSFVFDDEGVPGQKTILIDRGILKEYLYDRLAALKEGRKSTGNGRRESYSHRPLPRMRNTYLAPGEHTPAEIIRATPKGLYVRKMGGGQVNTTNGDFVFEVAEGYLIENGKIGEPVRGATLTGNGPLVLQKIDLVGNDLGFGLGTCGKNGQGVPVGDAQPTIRIPELIVGGILR